MLFDKGKRFTCSDFSRSDKQEEEDRASLRVCYLWVPRSEVWPQDVSGTYSCKLLVNAPKSRYKHAVDRNRINRLLREAFRFHKDLFAGLAPDGKVLLLSLQFAGGKFSLDRMRRLVEKTAGMLQSRLPHA